MMGKLLSPATQQFSKAENEVDFNLMLQFLLRTQPTDRTQKSLIRKKNRRDGMEREEEKKEGRRAEEEEEKKREGQQDIAHLSIIASLEHLKILRFQGNVLGQFEIRCNLQQVRQNRGDGTEGRRGEGRGMVSRDRKGG
eukprot:768264-Hanusia_phi.AAC.7